MFNLLPCPNSIRYSWFWSGPQRQTRGDSSIWPPGRHQIAWWYIPWTSPKSQNPKSKIPKIQNPQNPKSLKSKIQNPQNPKIQNPKSPKSKIPKIPKSKIQNPQNPKSPKSENPKSKIPKIQNPKSPKSKIQTFLAGSWGRQCCSPDCALALVTHHFVCATVHVSIVRLRCIDLSLSPLPISLEGRRKVFSCGVTSAALPKQALQE